MQKKGNQKLQNRAKQTLNLNKIKRIFSCLDVVIASG